MVDQPVERGSVKPTVDAVRSAGHDLLREMWQHLPRSIEADDHPWRAYGIAMLARIADVVESVLVLTDAEQAVDASTLARVLYEAVVKYCWISVDPDTRFQRWRADAVHWNHKLHTDAAKFGIDVMKLEQSDVGNGRSLPGMPQLAEDVDRYWGGRIEGSPAADASPNGLVTFRGLYLPLYRTLSESLHTRPEVVEAYLDLEPGMWSVGPAAAEDSFWLPIIPTLFAQALLVCHHQEGWPDPDRVRAINNAMYGVGQKGVGA